MRPVVFKAGVELTHRHFLPHVAIILFSAGKCAPRTHDNCIVVTSGRDGKHMRGSKHYDDEAFDIRAWATYRPAKGNLIARDDDQAARLVHEWVANMKEDLGEEYDILPESGSAVDPQSGHEIPYYWIHGEYDPR